jgi:hypothetical protein
MRVMLFVAPLLVLSAVASSATGCSSGSAPSSGAAAGLASLVVDTCNYRYECPAPEAGASLLAKSISPRDAGSHGRERMGHDYDGGTTCQAGYVTLGADGTGNYVDYAGDRAAHPVRWTLEDASLTVCEGAECITCTMLDVPSASSPSGTETKAGRCTGSADSCYGRGAGSCASQAGCDGHLHYPPYGSAYFECNGSAKDCDEFDSELACRDQSGCDWER